MGRVWTLAGALAAGCLIVYLLVGFMGTDALKFSSAGIGAGAAAAYLPGKAGLPRGFYLLLGCVFGSLSFLLGAAAFPDTNVGLVLGAIVPILFSALVAMGTKSAETLLVMLMGAGTMGAVYTTAFFADPQSINYTMPIALGQSMIVVAIGYILGTVAKVFGPQESHEEPAEPTPDEGDEDFSSTTAIPTVETTEVAR